MARQYYVTLLKPQPETVELFEWVNADDYEIGTSGEVSFYGNTPEDTYGKLYTLAPGTWHNVTDTGEAI